MTFTLICFKEPIHHHHLSIYPGYKSWINALAYASEFRACLSSEIWLNIRFSTKGTAICCPESIQRESHSKVGPLVSIFELSNTEKKTNRIIIRKKVCKKVLYKLLLIIINTLIRY